MKTEIIEFHQTEIYCPTEDGHVYVAVKPICEAFGISAHGQIERIKRSPIWSQLHVLIRATGSDHKQYEMVCLPLKYMFGWIFTIDAEKVRTEAREGIIAYQVECCDVLYEHFYNGRRQSAEKQKTLAKIKQDIEKLREQNTSLARRQNENTKTIIRKEQQFEQLALAAGDQIDLFLDQILPDQQKGLADE